MQNPVKERIVKLREEIKQISEANRPYMLGGTASERQRRTNSCVRLVSASLNTRLIRLSRCG
jgi:hypothetical protein